MSTATYAFAEVEALFKGARSVARAKDPLALAAAFPGLWLKPGYTLFTQFYEDGRGNGNGFTWAYPTTARLPQPRLKDWPKGAPAGALPPLSVIEGDGTPWSYLAASLLGRELQELGAQWHGCYWSTHSLYGGGPFRWEGPEWQHPLPWPESFLPTVTVDERGVTVIFYTMSELRQLRVIRHTDTYRPGQGLRYDAADETIAFAHGGYIF